MHLQSFKLLRLTINDEMYLQENAFYDLWVKVTGNVTMYPLHYVNFEVATCTPNG